MGIAGTALATLVAADDYWTFKVPDSMTLAAAATIPVIYGTVIYGLILVSSDSIVNSFISKLHYPTK